MRASEVLALLPAANIAERDALLLGLAEQGEIVAEWIDVKSGDLTVRVLRDALKWGEKGAAVRLGVTPRTQQQIADLLGAVLLTPKLVDVCAREAALAGGLVRPHTQPINSTTEGYAKHSAAIDADLPADYAEIVAGWKDWCVSADVFAKKGYATNYGWHIPKDKAKAWSPIPIAKLVPAVSLAEFFVVQGPYEAHTTGTDADKDGKEEGGHGDYSQLVRVAHRVARWKGVPCDLADVIRGKLGAEAAASVSHEGALADWRLPGVDVIVAPVVAADPRPSVPPTVIAVVPIVTIARPTIKRGSKGPDVEDWQRVISVTADGDFGPNTESKTRAWQATHGLTVDGIVGPKSWAAAGADGKPSISVPPPEQSGIKFVEAKHYRKVPAGRVIDLVVLHTAEVAETMTSAEAVAGFFKNPGVYPDGKPRQVSAHYCLDPKTRVLRSDLRWVPIGSVSVGDSLLGVDEDVPEPRQARTIQPSKVRAVSRRTAEALRILCADGRELVCSTDHRWLGRGASNGWKWIAAEELVEGSTLCAPLRAWPDRNDRDLGYLEGIFDGEGCFASCGDASFAQKIGPVFRRACGILDDEGIPYRIHEREGGVAVVCTSGLQATLSVLGMARPRRLMLEERWIGRSIKSRSHSNAIQVEAVERIGPSEVVSIETTARTFFAEGVVSHNCVDADSIVQCVPDRDVAFAAPGANSNGIQIELSGFARQTAVDWGDAFSVATLARAAGLVARILRENKIACAYVDWATLKRGGARGITTHDDVSRAWRQSDHTDPGKGFPMTAFVEAVRALV
jgi:hypothetical protein